MNISQLRVEMNRNLDSAKKIISKDKRLRPVAFIFHGKDHIDLSPLRFSNPREKELQMLGVAEYVKEKKAEAIIVIIESWTVERDIRNINSTNIIPSEQPDRKECLLVYGECVYGDIIMNQLFHRDNDNIVFDGEPMNMKGSIFGHTFGIKQEENPMFS